MLFDGVERNSSISRLVCLLAWLPDCLFACLVDSIGINISRKLLYLFLLSILSISMRLVRSFDDDGDDGDEDDYCGSEHCWRAKLHSSCV